MSEDLPASGRAEVVRRMLELDTANVADVLDEHGLREQALADCFRAVSGERLAGFAFTLAGTTEVAGTGRDELKFEACSRVAADEVTVWSGGGGGGAFLGEMIAIGLRESGCRGVVADGGVRDSRWLRELGFPVFATQVAAAQSAGRCRVTSYGEPITMPGAHGGPVTVNPGDLILADEDGVVVVPGAVVDDVLLRVEELTEHELAVRASLAEGLSLAECLARHGKV